MMAVAVVFAGRFVFADDIKSASVSVTSSPVYVPDVSHASDPLPDGVLVWNNLMQTTDAAADQATAQFTFVFTNVASKIDMGLATNVTSVTNFTTTTNSSFWASLWGKKITQVPSIARSTNMVVATNSVTPVPVTILSVHPSCGCTTAQLPPLPWTVPGGASGQIGVTVNLQGKAGTLFKTVDVGTDKGLKKLMVRINILPPVVLNMTDGERAMGVAAAKVDRQAIFKGDCASCHAKNVQGRYGKDLYDSVCGICHEAEHRATMVPDLHVLTVPTNDDFWRTWISFGKPGTLMAAFATSQGGPLSDSQIASLAQYLTAAMPSHVVSAPK